jgi:lysozyme
VENDPFVTVTGLCVTFEGVYLKPYLCPAGIPTIGIGSTRYEDGVRVTLKDPPITKERAFQLLRWELQHECLPAVQRLCPNLLSWGPNAVAAIMDFTYNLGSGRLASSTLRKRIQADDKQGAMVELMKWTKGGGKVLPGLYKRRCAEVALIGA